MSHADACPCLDAPRRDLLTLHFLGMDRVYAEISLLQCPDCGRRWLRYFYEHEAFTGSGRWYLGLLSPVQEQGLTTENARQILEQLEWYFYGGSYYGGKTGKTSGPIYL